MRIHGCTPPPPHRTPPLRYVKKALVNRPLVDSSLLKHDDRWFIFTSVNSLELHFERHSVIWEPECAIDRVQKFTCPDWRD